MTTRVFLVGLGQRMEAHREALARLPAVALEGGYDPAPLARERWTGTGLRVYQDLRAGLTDVAPDVVVVATPPAARSSVIAGILDTLKPRLIVIEKPLALSSSEGADLAARCRAAGVPFRVAHQLPFTPEFAALLQWVREGGLGELREIEATCYGSLFDQGSHLLNVAVRLLGGATLSVVDCEASDDLVALAREAAVPARYHVDAAHHGRAWLRAHLVTDKGVSIRLGCGLLAPRPIAGLGPWLQKRITLSGANGRAEAHVASHASAWLAGDPAPRRVASSVAHYEQALLGFYGAVLDQDLTDPVRLAEAMDQELATLRLLTAVHDAGATGPRPRPRGSVAGDTRRPPVVSVIMPMEDHRGMGARAVRSWTTGQRCEPDAFELIVLLDEHTRDLEGALAGLLRSHDRLIVRAAANEMELYDLGATLARGDILFFTEPHCTAEAEAVAETIGFFERSTAAGFCGRTVPVCENAIATLESRMYDAGFEGWSRPESWEKVIVRAVGLRKEAYLAAGGFQPRYHRFAEWLLAAELKRRGYRLEYAPAVGVTHLYSDRLSLLDEFIREFTDGESLYRHEHEAGDAVGEFFGAPAEWEEASTCDEKFDRSAFVTALRAVFSRSQPGLRARGTALQAAGRLLPRALFGRRWLVARYRIAALAAKAAAATPLLPAETRYRLFLAYWQRTTEFCRVRFAVERGGAARGAPAGEGENLLAEPGSARRLVNFYGWEEHGGTRFRWSQPLSALRVDAGAQPQRVTLEVLDVRGRDFARDIRLVHQGGILDPVQVEQRDDRTVLSVTVGPDPSAPSWLYWITPAWRLARRRGDPRRLGVPLTSITLAESRRRP